MTRDDLAEVLKSAQMQGFMHVIGAGETSAELTDRDFRTINGGGTFSDFSRHPSDGIPTTQGGKAAGFAQFLGTTWKGLREEFGFPDFSPQCQLEGAAALILERGAWPFIEHGDLASAIQRLASTWVSLPGLGVSKAERIFVKYGGVLPVVDYGAQAPEQPQNVPAPRSIPEPQPAPAAPTGQPMPFLALLPLIAQFIPQIMTLIKPNSVSTAKDAQVASTILNTVVQAAGIVTADGKPAPVDAASVGQAAEKMAADPTLAKQVQAAVVTHPDIMPLLEVGGGVAAAREADLKVMAAPEPFWKASAVFWISVILLPMVYWLVGSLIVGGVPLPADWPWYAQLPFKLLGTAWNGESRSGGFNLVIGLILGGICGVYYGVSVTQNKQQQAPTQQGTGQG